MKVTQFCKTLCDPMDCTIHGTLQARILDWVAFPFSRGFSQSRDRTQVSCIAGGFYQLSSEGSRYINICMYMQTGRVQGPLYLLIQTSKC